MGKFNAFKDLKSNAEKVTSLRQLRALHELRTDQKISDSEWATVGRGVCTSLCMAWLQKMFANERFGSRPIDDMFHQFSVMDLVKEHIPNYIRYIDTASKTNPLQAIKDLAQQYKLTFTCKAVETVFESILNSTKNVLNQSGAIGTFAVVKIKGRENGHHSFAFYRLGDDFSFFDPNLGAYVMVQSAWSQFFTTYVDLVKKNFECTIEPGTWGLIKEQQ
jgi:hypothetical protein